MQTIAVKCLWNYEMKFLLQVFVEFKFVVTFNRIKAGLHNNNFGISHASSKKTSVHKSHEKIKLNLLDTARSPKRFSLFIFIFTVFMFIYGIKNIFISRPNEIYFRKTITI